MQHLSTRRNALQTVAACLAAGTWPLRARAATVSDGQWQDTARNRSLPWRLRVPESPGPWPLVLFSHGLGGNVEAGTAWGEAWAAAGLAVLHLQHPGSDTETLRSGLRQLKAAATAEQLMVRVADVRFTLDELARRAGAGESPWTQMRQDALGLAGHSFGAQTTQALAGQRFPVPGNAADPRLRAFIAFSPSPPRGGRQSMADTFGGISRPFLGVTSSEDGDPLGSQVDGEARAQVLQGLPPGQRALLWLDGADHMTFAGQALRRLPSFGLFKRHGPAAERQPQHHALVASITTDWWRAQLLGDAAARERLARPEGLGEKDRWQFG